MTIGKHGEINMHRTMARIAFVMSILLISNVAQAEKVGSAKSSGIIFSDTITVTAVDDPDYPSVVCYTTDVEIGGPNLVNPTDSSIACRLVDTFKGVAKSKKNVFTKSKSIFFYKHLVVDRFYDPKRNVLIYLSYTKKFTGKNASHSVSVVPLGKPLIK